MSPAALQALVRALLAHCGRDWRLDGWRVVRQPCEACRALAARSGSSLMGASPSHEAQADPRRGSAQRRTSAGVPSAPQLPPALCRGGSPRWSASSPAWWRPVAPFLLDRAAERLTVLIRLRDQAITGRSAGGTGPSASGTKTGAGPYDPGGARSGPLGAT